MNRRASLMTLLILAVSLSAVSAYACTCINTRTPLEELAFQDAVFTGRVISVSDFDASNIIVVFQVHAVWKGSAAPQAVVLTPLDGAQCGVSFTVGEEYLAYADDNSYAGFLFTHLCTRTNPLIFAEDDLVALGAPATVATKVLGWGMLKDAYR
jgi:hypothetical protein